MCYQFMHRVVQEFRYARQPAIYKNDLFDHVREPLSDSQSHERPHRVGYYYYLFPLSVPQFVGRETSDGRDRWPVVMKGRIRQDRQPVRQVDRHILDLRDHKIPLANVAAEAGKEQHQCRAIALPPDGGDYTVAFVAV